MSAHGYEPQRLIDAVWKGTVAMIRNDGASTNHDVFWRVFAGLFGKRSYDDIPLFDEFYETDFNKVKAVCGYNERAADTVRALKADGIKLVLASNPIFPSVAQKTRMRWAGVEPDDFEYITSYENSHYCKPDPAYYSEILDKIGYGADECVMVGNDAVEDVAAEKVGIKVFLLTDCMINRDGKDISAYPHGGFDKLNKFFAENKSV